MVDDKVLLSISPPARAPEVPTGPTGPIAPRPSDGSDDRAVAELAAGIAEMLREAQAARRPLMPVIETIRADAPLAIVVTAMPALRAIVEQAIGEALTILEAEAAAKRAKRAKPGRRRKSTT